MKKVRCDLHLGGSRLQSKGDELNKIKRRML